MSFTLNVSSKHIFKYYIYTMKFYIYNNILYLLHCYTTSHILHLTNLMLLDHPHLFTEFGIFFVFLS